MSRKNIKRNRPVDTPKKSYDSSLRVLNLSGYEVPSVTESKRYDWVEYGDDNDYFAELIERYLGSATTSRCINGIVDII